MTVLVSSPGNRHVVLNWTKSITDTQYDETIYKIYYKQSGGSWTQYGQLFIKDTTTSIYYSVSDLTNGAPYEFKVTVINPSAKSERDILVSASTTPNSSLTSSQAPQNLKFSSGVLSWDAPTNLITGRTGYVIQFKSAKDNIWGAYSSVYFSSNLLRWPTTDATQRSYTFQITGSNSQLIPGEDYDFRVTIDSFSSSVNDNYVGIDRTRFDGGITTRWSSEIRATAIQTSIPSNPNGSWKFIPSLPSDPILSINSTNIDVNIFAFSYEAAPYLQVTPQSDSAGYYKIKIEKQIFSDNKQVILASAYTAYYRVSSSRNKPLFGYVLYLSMNGGQTWRVLLDQTSLGEKTSYRLIKVNNDGSFAIVREFVDYRDGVNSSFIFYDNSINPYYSIIGDWLYNTIRYASLTDNNIGLCLLGNNQPGSTDSSTSLYVMDTQRILRKSPSYLAVTSDFWSRDVATHSGDGKIIAYVSGTSTLFLSTDSGVNWRSKTYSFLIKGIASSRNGKYIYLLSDNNSSFISRINTIDMNLDSSFNASNPTNSTINYRDVYIEMAKTDDALYFIPDDSLRQRWELPVSNGGSVPPVAGQTPTPTKTKAPTSIVATPTRTKIAITPTRTPTRKINQNIILPLTNYTTNNANIYSPYTGSSKIVCLFNEPDGFFTDIKNEIPTANNISYLQANESVISNNTLVPKTANSTFSTIELNNLFNQYYNSNFTIEYYFYLNNDKITTIYNGYGYAENVSVGSNLVEWKLIYDPNKGLIYDRPTSITNLNITLQQGWYHFAVSTYDANFRYFINGQSIFPNHSINQMTVSTVKPYFKSYVDKLDSLRVSDEGLYSGPFTVLPHNQNPGVTPIVTKTPTRTKAAIVPTRTPSSTKPGNTVTNIVATGGNECIYVTWDIPGRSNGLLGYKLYYNYYDITNFQFVPALNGDMLNPLITKAVITNVPNDTGYQVQVRIDAIYSDGTTYSAPEVMQYTRSQQSIPNSPILTLTNPPTSATAVLTWTSPVNQSIGNFNWRNESSLLIYNSNGVLEFQSDYLSNFNSYTVVNKNGKYFFDISARYVNDFDRSIAPIYVKSNRVTKTLNAVVATSTPTPTNTATPTVTPTTTPVILPEFINISLQENNFNKSNNYFNLDISSISSNYPVLNSDSYDIEINGPYPFDDILHVASLQSNSVTEDIITQPWRKTETRTANTLSDKIYITPAILGIYYVRIKRLVSNTYSDIQPFFRSFDIIEVPPTPTVTPTTTNTPTVTNTPSVTPQINPTPTRTPTKAIPGLTSIPTSTPSQTPTRTPFVPRPINELDYTTAQIGVRDSVTAGYSVDCVISFNKPISYGGKTWEKLFLTFNGNHIKALYDNENLPKTHRVYTTTEGFFQTFTSNVLGLHQLKNITLTIESQNNNRYLWIVTAQYDKNTAGISTPMYAAGTVLNFEILLDYSQGKKTNATLVASRATSPYPYSVWEYSYDPSQFLIDFDINVNTISIPVTPTVTPTISLTPTNTQTNTPTNTSTPSATVTPTPTNIDTSVTRTPTPTNTITSTNTATPTITATPTVTPSTSAAPSLEVHSVGDNLYGQLCNPFAGGSLSEFAKIDDIMIALIGRTQTSEIKEVSCGNLHTCFITNNGNVYSVGRNAQGQLGRSAPTTAEQITPGKVIFPGGDSSPFVQVSCGASHTFALNSKGELYSWGNNTNGQLSLGDNIDRPTPVLVSGMINGAPSDPGVWKYVACGSFHTLAINISGELYACGLNTDGQLGLSDNRDRLKLRKVTVNGNWVSAVGGGYHTLALNSAGQLYSCGNNSKGQLGAGTVGVNTNVLGLSNSNITKISAGLYHSICLINSSPTEVCGCGENSFNQISNASNNYQPSPSVTGWRAMFYGTEISCGYNHTLILTNNNLLYGCGDNSKGQLGIRNNASNNNRLTQIADNGVVRKLANKQGSTHSLIFVDQGSTISLPPTPTRSNTPTPTPTKRPPGSTATATPTNSVTPTATPTPSKAPSIILDQSVSIPKFNIFGRNRSYLVSYTGQTISYRYNTGTVYEDVRTGALYTTYDYGARYARTSQNQLSQVGGYVPGLGTSTSITDDKNLLLIIYDQDWNIFKYFNADELSLYTRDSSNSKAYSLGYASSGGKLVNTSNIYNYDTGSGTSYYYPSTVSLLARTVEVSERATPTLEFPINASNLPRAGSGPNYIVLYGYNVSVEYNLQTLVNQYLNRTTADYGYNSVNIKFTPLGWYKTDPSMTTEISKLNEYSGNLEEVSNIQDYITAKVIIYKNNSVRLRIRTTSDTTPVIDTILPNDDYPLKYSEGNQPIPNPYATVRVKTNATGEFSVSLEGRDGINRYSQFWENVYDLSGPYKTLTINSIAPNPIVSPTSTKTPTPTKTPSPTPTSVAKTTISPISNYVPGNTTIYTPYKTSGTVCIFNEPDGSDYIRNQINDPKAYVSASTSKIMGNCLVPRVPNPTNDSPYATIIAGTTEDIVPNFTIEYYFYLNSNKDTTIYSSDASYYDSTQKMYIDAKWKLKYSPLSGLVSEQNQDNIELNSKLQTGWYHFAVSFDKGDFRYFINGKQIAFKFNIFIKSTAIRPRVATYVDQLDALRITNESLYYVPFTTLPHM